MTQGAPQEDQFAAGPAFDPTVPSPARVWNFWVGGKDHFEADRVLAARFGQVVPQMPLIARLTRQFLADTVSQLAANGIRQFLDIGTGLPTMNSVHEVTQSVAPESRVAYVDNDPVVLTHARAMLHNLPGIMIASHDLRDPVAITGDPAIRSLIDFDQPVAVLLIAVLHFIADQDDPARIVSALMAAVPAGSCLVISHLTADHYTHADKAAEVYEDTASGLHLRSRGAVEALFNGFPLLPPGELAYAGDWHPDQETPPACAPGGSAVWCGIAQKR